MNNFFKKKAACFSTSEPISIRSLGSFARNGSPNMNMDSGFDSPAGTPPNGGSNINLTQKSGKILINLNRLLYGVPDHSLEEFNSDW